MDHLNFLLSLLGQPLILVLGLRWTFASKAACSGVGWPSVPKFYTRSKGTSVADGGIDRDVLGDLLAP